MWILIIFITSGDGHAISTAEFKNKGLCESAGDAWVKMADGTFRGARYLCAPAQ